MTRAGLWHGPPPSRRFGGQPDPAAPYRGRSVAEERDDALERDGHPIGAVVELVGQLVERLLEEERVEEDRPLLAIARQERRAIDRRPGSAQEGGCDPHVPVPRPAVEANRVRRWDRAG